MACAPEDTVPTAAANDSVTDLEGLPVSLEGSLSGQNGYTSRGDIDVIFNSVEDTYSIIMSDFRSSNGPSLKVYLSEATNPRNILNLGNLKSTNGNLRYDFPASSFNPDFTHLLIWCDQFDTGFGQASLSAP